MDDGETQSNGNGIGPILEGGQLSYLEHGCTSIPEELGESYGSKVTRLDLSFNCIRSLDGLDRFTVLEELVLDNNEIDDNIEFPQMPKLHTLLINKNKIKNVDSFTNKLQANLPSLTYLSMLGNQACPNELLATDKDEEDYQRFRYFVIYRLPKLRFLDSRPVKESERTEAKRVGALMVVVTVTDEPDVGVSADNDEKYNPLPENTKDGDQHQAPTPPPTPPLPPKYHTPPKHSLLRMTLSNGSDRADSSDTEHSVNSGDEDESTRTFGRCRYVYYGRHSEGNRFIKNQDL